MAGRGRYRRRVADWWMTAGTYRPSLTAVVAKTPVPLPDSMRHLPETLEITNAFRVFL